MKKIWTTAIADKKFSLYIRERDGKCMRCGKRPPTVMLQCSHFWHRGHSSTRYDPENCIALCAGCHLFHWEVEKQGAYRDFMIKWLGMRKYNALEKRARSIKKRDEAILECQKLLTKTASHEAVQMIN